MDVLLLLISGGQIGKLHSSTFVLTFDLMLLAQQPIQFALTLLLLLLFVVEFL